MCCVFPILFSKLYFGIAHDIFVVVGGYRANGEKYKLLHEIYIYMYAPITYIYLYIYIYSTYGI